MKTDDSLFKESDWIFMQHTLNRSLSLEGIGLHTGAKATVTLKPAGADEGITFIRTDIADRDNRIPALWSGVQESPLCTLLNNKDGVSLSTVEHVMAALAGCGIDNALIEVDGPEVPILDGSAAPYARPIMRDGLKEQHVPRRAIEILKKVEIKDEDKYAALVPSPALSYSFRIDYPDAAIGYQEKLFYHADASDFAETIAPARSFARAEDIDLLRAQGLIRGGSLDNAVVVDDETVLNPEGLRFEDEFVRHKLLDAMGDLYLAGGPLAGAFVSSKGGHALTNRLLHALFENPEHYRRTNDFLGLEGNREIPCLGGGLRAAAPAPSRIS